MIFFEECANIFWRRGAAINPGVAKFGIALEWGSRGLEFESRHSDQKFQLFTVKGEKLELFLFMEKWFVVRNAVLLPMYYSCLLPMFLHGVGDAAKALDVHILI